MAAVHGRRQEVWGGRGGGGACVHACVRACACVPVLEDEGWGIAVLLFGDVENLAMNAVKEAEIPVSRVGGTG